MNAPCRIAKYLRLSSEDENIGESNSIANQRDLLDDYISRNFNMRNLVITEFLDDGFSGINFNRPGIQKLLSAIEENAVDCIVVKDFSRFGRNYIDVGEYLEIIFPSKQIRFISVNDHYDSDQYKGMTSGLEVAFKNVVNELYSRDLSQKVKSGHQIRMKQGKYCSPYAFYGYKKAPDDKNKLVVDEKAAEIVRRIYSHKLKGKSRYEIAKMLNNEGILCPAMYKQSNNIIRAWNSPNPTMVWNDTAIGKILNDERYTGIMIGGKQKRKAVGSHQIRSVPKEKWICVPNTHEAIISAEIFKQVHAKNIVDHHYEPFKKSTCKLLYCAGCGHVLQHTGKTTKRFYCKYTTFSENPNCFHGVMLENEIADLLCTAIKKQIECLSGMQDKHKKIQSTDTVEQEIQFKKRKISKLTNERFSWYKKFRAKILTEEEFAEKRNNVNLEIELLEKSVAALENQINLYRADEEIIGEFLQFENFQTLTSDIILTLIEKVYVYEQNKIEIIWKHNNTLIHNHKNCISVT